MFAQKLEAAFHRRFSDTIIAIDSHVGGEPARLIIPAAPVPGRTTNDKRLYLAGHRDEIRLLLTREPRGHRDMFASILTEPESNEAAFGLVYMDARRYPYLCGHATMAAASVLIELGLIEARPPQTEVVVDTPSGPWRTTAHLRQETAAGESRLVVESVAIRPEAAFAYLLDQPLLVPHLGVIRVDVACTGGFFVMVSAEQIGLELSVDNAPRLAELGMAIIEAGNAQLQVQHPQRPYVNTIDVVEFFDPGGHAAGRGKNFVVLGEGHIDRSPCGTGTCAKLALLYQRGELAVGQPFINEGLLGTTFEARIIRETMVGHLPAIIPEVSGAAFLTGLHHFVTVPGDPLSRGFLL
jgi:proline racemase